jgi:glycosyltransferase involved in cell wall biosynthesis
MRIAVYGIAKNEEAHAAGWAASARDADLLVVTDTGSTDGTVGALRSHGVTVHEARIRPWRFDHARNVSLDHVPADVDVCVALDLDERLVPGWRKLLEERWRPTTTLMRYLSVQTWSPDGVPTLTIYGHKAHARHAYRWHYAIHELLRPTGRHEEVICNEYLIHQFQDEQRDRGFYLEMLNELVRTEPEESRYAFYRAMELANRQRFEEAITEAERYFRLESNYDPSERSFVLRCIAWAKKGAGRPADEVIRAFIRAAVEFPHQREPWVGLAAEMASVGNWPNCFAAATNALRIRKPDYSFRIENAAWDGTAERLFLAAGRALGIPDGALGRALEEYSRAEENANPLQILQRTAPVA